MGTDRGFRPDGTLAQEFIDLPDGTSVTKNYDKTGKMPIKQVDQEDEIRELVKSAELLSSKRKKYHITSIWKERGK